jgi:hypothetical protein
VEQPSNSPSSPLISSSTTTGKAAINSPQVASSGPRALSSRVAPSARVIGEGVRKHNTYFYCDRCGSGPMLLGINSACPSCHHPFCRNCTVEKR